MTLVLEEKDLYLEHFREFERAMAEFDRPALRRIQKAAIVRFAATGFPTNRTEDWRFTSLARLLSLKFALAPAVFPRGKSQDDGYILLNEFNNPPDVLGCLDGGQAMAFVNGFFFERSGSACTPGVILGNLFWQLWEEDVDHELTIRHLGRHARCEDSAFAALNTAFIHDGAFIRVPRNTVVPKPIHLIFISSNPAGPSVSHPRTLVIVEDNSQATIVESYVGPEGEVYFANAVTEIVAGENAAIDHYKVQRESLAAFHVATTQVHQARTSKFSTHYIGLGGKLVRNEVRVRFDGEGCEATVNGLYMARGSQHMDNFTVIDHAMPNCASHELYKGILDGKSHGVFNGKIFVRQDAQKTDAKQTNQTLLLSDDATINTKPQLEIFADDVKCTHGATVGQLDETSLFYLRSRGIGLEAARSLLTYAFANDIIGRVKVESVRSALEVRLLEAQHLPRNDWAEESP